MVTLGGGRSVQPAKGARNHGADLAIVASSTQAGEAPIQRLLQAAVRPAAAPRNRREPQLQIGCVLWSASMLILCERVQLI